MDNRKPHIKEELEKLKANNLLSHQVKPVQMPSGLKSELLDKVKINNSDNPKNRFKISKIVWPLGMAAVLIVGFWLWMPSETIEPLSMDMLSVEELSYYIDEHIEDFSEDDLIGLASNDAGIFDYSSIDIDYLDEELMEDIDFTYDELF